AAQSAAAHAAGRSGVCALRCLRCHARRDARIYLVVRTTKEKTMTVNSAVQDNVNLPELKSLSVLKFGPGNVLFAGDSNSATLFAFDLGDAQPAEKPQFYNLHNIDSAIAEILGAPVSEITVKDLAVHPITQDAYLAVHRGHGDQALPVVVKVNCKRE